MDVTLKNSFHNRIVRIRLRGAFMSEGQRRKVWQTLCGNHACKCSPVTGIHGEQSIYTTILSQEYDSMGRLVPRFLVK
jgi:hypothetical protein